LGIIIIILSCEFIGIRNPSSDFKLRHFPFLTRRFFASAAFAFPIEPNLADQDIL
jgi:hypothetical protein